MKGAAVIFFAYIGFDAVSTAAEEVVDPQRNLPLGIMGSLLVCTVLYIVVAAVLTGMTPYKTIDVNAPLASAFVESGTERHLGDCIAGRGGRPDLGAAGAAAGPVAGVFCDVARRPAAARVLPRPSALPNALHPHDHDRYRGRPDRRIPADPGDRRTDQYRHLVCVRPGVYRSLDPASRGPRPPASLSGPHWCRWCRFSACCSAAT